MIIFDVEIKKGILGKGETPLPGIEYCGGWRDFENMGVACVCTFDTLTHLSRVFTTSRLQELEAYLATAPTGGFNTRRFDMPCLAAHGVKIAQELHYDALEQIWLKLGLNADQFSSLHAGWGLDAVMQATFGLAKTGHGAMAPVWWQQRHHSKVIDYCLNDVWLEAKLCLYMRNGGLVKAAGKEPLQFEKPRPTVAELEEILKQDEMFFKCGFCGAEAPKGHHICGDRYTDVADRLYRERELQERLRSASDAADQAKTVDGSASDSQ